MDQNKYYKKKTSKKKKKQLTFLPYYITISYTFTEEMRMKNSLSWLKRFHYHCWKIIIIGKQIKRNYCIEYIVYVPGKCLFSRVKKIIHMLKKKKNERENLLFGIYILAL